MTKLFILFFYLSTATNLLFATHKPGHTTGGGGGNGNGNGKGNATPEINQEGIIAIAVILVLIWLLFLYKNRVARNSSEKPKQ